MNGDGVCVIAEFISVGNGSITVVPFGVVVMSAAGIELPFAKLHVVKRQRKRRAAQ